MPRWCKMCANLTGTSAGYSADLPRLMLVSRFGGIIARYQAEGKLRPREQSTAL